MPIAILAALAAGAMLPLQAVVNARLGRVLGSPIWAAAISGAVTTVALALFGLLATRSFPRTDGVDALPSWAWTGGLCGAFVLAAMTATVPRLGAATMIAMVVAGQAIFSVVIDHFGLFGVEAHPVTLQRFAAACLLLAGALLIR